jgi:hypothetical protein
MPLDSVTPLAAAGPLAGAICVLGLVAVAGWGCVALRADVGARHGLVLVVGGVGVRQPGRLRYCVAFLVLGAAAWGGGTLWYARRRGRWPSALSARLFTRVLGSRSPLSRLEIPAVVILPRWRR